MSRSAPGSLCEGEPDAMTAASFALLLNSSSSFTAWSRACLASAMATSNSVFFDVSTASVDCRVLSISEMRSSRSLTCSFATSAMRCALMSSLSKLASMRDISTLAVLSSSSSSAILDSAAAAFSFNLESSRVWLLEALCAVSNSCASRNVSAEEFLVDERISDVLLSNSVLSQALCSSSALTSLSNLLLSANAPAASAFTRRASTSALFFPAVAASNAVTYPSIDACAAARSRSLRSFTSNNSRFVALKSSLSLVALSKSSLPFTNILFASSACTRSLSAVFTAASLSVSVRRNASVVRRNSSLSSSCFRRMATAKCSRSRSFAVALARVIASSTVAPPASGVPGRGPPSESPIRVRSRVRSRARRPLASRASAVDLNVCSHKIFFFYG